MEDIEILEEFIEQYNASYPEEKEWVAIYPNQVQAIENLIARNKEIEEELNNSVSKYEIKAKIEEYQENMKKYEYADKNIFNENNIRQEVITVLQELLNKGE